MDIERNLSTTIDEQDERITQLKKEIIKLRKEEHLRNKTLSKNSGGKRTKRKNGKLKG